MPPVVSENIEEPEPGSPYGVKGIGESATIVAPAAVVAAIRDPTGLEVNRAPVHLDDVAGLREPSPSRGWPNPDVPWQHTIPELAGLGMGQQQRMREGDA
jgi:hypothetical protein